MNPKKQVTNECVICGKKFEIVFNRAKTKVTCSKECLTKWRVKKYTGNQYAKGHKPNSTSFKVGSSPWNKNLKGIHLSPNTEFKKGHTETENLPIGSLRFRIDKNGKRRAWIKTEILKWEMRAVIVWERKYGKVPRGFVIHHRDRHTTNDVLLNLICLSRSAHIIEHRQELLEAKRKKPKF